MKPQIHAAQKHAWIDGAIVEYKNSSTKLWTRCCDNKPQWDEFTEYRASIAEVEGKPVFVGDVLYNQTGQKFIAGVNYNSAWSWLSWNPPAPRTITVTIPRPEFIERIDYHSQDGIKKRADFQFNSDEARESCIKAIEEALK